MAYASTLGLARFTMDGGAAGEYERFDARLVYRKNARSVATRVEPNGRSRVKAPFRFLGHFVCTGPDSALGLFWCLDLLRSGYAYVHIPTAGGLKRLSLAGQLARNCLSASA